MPFAGTSFFGAFLEANFECFLVKKVLRWLLERRGNLSSGPRAQVVPARCVFVFQKAWEIHYITLLIVVYLAWILFASCIFVHVRNGLFLRMLIASWLLMACQSIVLFYLLALSTLCRDKNTNSLLSLIHRNLSLLYCIVVIRQVKAEKEVRRLQDEGDIVMR